MIGARAVQGLGAAIISPAALSIVMTCFEEGAERNKALGIWGALGGSGAAVGVLAGGLLTESLGWEWIFWVNVPVGALVLALTPFIVPESFRETARRRYDPLGAISVTAGLTLLVYAISEAPDVGWLTARTILLLVASRVLLLSFLVIERTVAEPLMPFGIFRVGTVAGANVVGALLGAVIFANFFLLTSTCKMSSASPPPCRRHLRRDRGHGGNLGGCRPGVDDEARRKTGHDVRSRAVNRRDDLVRADPGRRQLRSRPPSWVPDGRRGIAFAFVPVSIAALAGCGAKPASRRA